MGGQKFRSSSAGLFGPVVTREVVVKMSAGATGLRLDLIGAEEPTSETVSHSPPGLMLAVGRRPHPSSFPWGQPRGCWSVMTM